MHGRRQALDRTEGAARFMSVVEKVPLLLEPLASQSISPLPARRPVDQRDNAGSRGHLLGLKGFGERQPGDLDHCRTATGCEIVDGRRLTHVPLSDA